MAKYPVPVETEKTRRLSPWRVLLAIIMVCGLATSTVYGLRQYRAAQPTVSDKPWFAAYVDVTATPTFAFEQLGTSNTRDAMLSFIVSDSKDACDPSWGAHYNLDRAGDSLDLDRRIARLQQQKGSVAVSFGGIRNSELALKCTDQDKLFSAYKSVIDRYKINTIDLDLEKEGLTNKDAAVRRATVLAKLQAERRAAGKPLAIWITLPVTPQGLTEDGTNAISALLEKDVDLAGVNVMTMDYGSSMTEGQTMLTASESALRNSARQLQILYQRAGIRLNIATVWAKMGATAMIGQNDVADEIFTLKDAKGLNKFARAHGMSRMSMWSANRDLACGSNYVNLKVVSDSCSGVAQTKMQFATLLSEGFKGSMSKRAGLITKADAVTALKPDDPAKSPYQIWSAAGAYLQGTKVVWHHNVYQAKWWTQGDTPDSPVLQSWQTPWELIGPVLPGEKPIKQATLPDGTYPDWEGGASYNTGDRILFNGVPYQAKWWNQGQSPAAASSNPNSSPWIPLTQAQIDEIVNAQS